MLSTLTTTSSILRRVLPRSHINIVTPTTLKNFTFVKRDFSHNITLQHPLKGLKSKRRSEDGDQSKPTDEKLVDKKPVDKETAEKPTEEPTKKPIKKRTKKSADKQPADPKTQSADHGEVSAEVEFRHQRLKELESQKEPLTEAETKELLSIAPVLTTRIAQQVERAALHHPEYLHRRKILDEQLEHDLNILDNEKLVRRIISLQRRQKRLLKQDVVKKQSKRVKAEMEKKAFEQMVMDEEKKPFDRSIPVTPSNVEKRLMAGEQIPYRTVSRALSLAVMEAKKDPKIALGIKSIQKKVTWRDVQKLIEKDENYLIDDFVKLVPPFMEAFEKLYKASNASENPQRIMIDDKFALELHKSLVQVRPKDPKEAEQFNKQVKQATQVMEIKSRANPPLKHIKEFIQPYLLLVNITCTLRDIALTSKISHLIQYGMHLPLDLDTYERIVDMMCQAMQFTDVANVLTEAEAVRGLAGTTHLYKMVYEMIKKRITDTKKFKHSDELYMYKDGYDALKTTLKARGILRDVIPIVEQKILHLHFRNHGVNVRQQVSMLENMDETEDVVDEAFDKAYKEWLAVNEKENQTKNGGGPKQITEGEQEVTEKKSQDKVLELLLKETEKRDKPKDATDVNKNL